MIVELSETEKATLIETLGNYLDGLDSDRDFYGEENDLENLKLINEEIERVTALRKKIEEVA
jgi:hypothetical protein